MSTVSSPSNEVAANGNEATQNYTTPLVDVRQTEDGFELRAEMPGVPKDGVEITVDNGHLTLVGRRAPVTVSGQPVYRERREHDFRRSYELDPSSIDASRVTAKMDNGVLTLVLPKAESLKPRRITLS